jgi:hypothetical protein
MTQFLGQKLPRTTKYAHIRPRQIDTTMRPLRHRSVISAFLGGNLLSKARPGANGGYWVRRVRRPSPPFQFNPRVGRQSWRNLHVQPVRSADTGSVLLGPVDRNDLQPRTGKSNANRPAKERLSSTAPEDFQTGHTDPIALIRLRRHRVFRERFEARKLEWALQGPDYSEGSGASVAAAPGRDCRRDRHDGRTASSVPAQSRAPPPGCSRR